MNQPLPLDKSLPAEIATTASQLLQYLRYPVFSWSWWWRRMLFFAPVAAVIAIGTGNDHGEFANSATQALSIAWHVAIVGMWFVGGGALLATLVRHAGLRLSLERILVVVAILAGFFMAEAADRWANRYHNELMCAHRGQVDCPEPVKKIDDTALGLTLRFAVPVGLYFAFGGGFALLSYFKELQSWREREQRQEHERLRLAKSEADLRLSILQAQVEPHFLFNTLASLRSLIQSDPRRAEAALDALVDHLRATLPATRGGVGSERPSTLAQQLEICSSYLEVMRVRLGSRFSYSIDVPPAFGELSFPPFMLISLVENAVKHGVERKPGVCKVTIAAAEIDAGSPLLEVSVTDDGAGLQEGLGTGVGLSNIRAQLALRFGGEASLSLRSGQQGGAVAALRIPFPSRV